MSETFKNLLYLLPDVAYIVELAKSKDSDSLKIRDYLQINGNFMNENEILEESIKKLSSRIQPKEYDLILPDFLFTNTVITVEEKGEEKKPNTEEKVGAEEEAGAEAAKDEKPEKPAEEK